MKVRFSYLLALGAAGAISYYMLTGKMVVGGQADAFPQTIAERQTKAEEQLFAVRTETFKAEKRAASMEIRGRTEADASVSVRAQTSGILEIRHVAKGDHVNAGDLLCTIETGAREAKVLEARAALIRANVDLAAAQKLTSRGFSAKNQVPALEAARDAAKARVQEYELDLERTKVKARISGIVQDPIAEVGDMLGIGDVCVTLIDRDPIIIVGQVSEREIGKLSPDMVARSMLATGESVTGKIRYIAPAADPLTRTFRVEIAVPNSDGSLKDGVTARTVVKLKDRLSHKIPASAMTLADDGRVGVRAVGPDNIVEFLPVSIIGGSSDGMWVAGLPDEIEVITVGQEFVIEGQKVSVSNLDAGPRS